MSAVERGRYLLFDAHRPDLAEVELRRALGKEPENAFCQALLAHCLVSLGKIEEASQVIAGAVRLRPDYAYVHRIRGWILGRQGSCWLAEAAYREALRLDPHDDSYDGLAWILIAQGRAKEALEVTDQGLAMQPDDLGCLIRRVEALVRLEDFESAQETIDDALRINPQSGQVHSFQGWLWERRRCYVKALRSYRAALRMDPLDNWTQARHSKILRLVPRVIMMVLGYAILIVWIAFFVTVNNEGRPATLAVRLTYARPLTAAVWFLAVQFTYRTHELSLTPFARLLGTSAESARARRVTLVAAALLAILVIAMTDWLAASTSFVTAMFVLVASAPLLLALPEPGNSPLLSRLHIAAVAGLGATLVMLVIELSPDENALRGVCMTGVVFYGLIQLSFLLKLIRHGDPFGESTIS